MISTKPHAIVDQIARPAYAYWQYNGHRVNQALEMVTANANDPALRAEALASVDVTVIVETLAATFTIWAKAEHNAFRR